MHRQSEVTIIIIAIETSDARDLAVLGIVLARLREGDVFCPWDHHCTHACTGYIHKHADTLIPMPTPVLLTHKHAYSWVKIYVCRLKVRENVT